MDKAERTKKYIVERVAPVFNQKGYAATSLKDLTDVTGLTKGAIYGNFRNKDEVALHAFEHNAGFVNTCLRGNILAAGSSREKLLAYPGTFRRISRQILKLGGCPILNTAVDSSEVNEKLHNAVQKVIDRWKHTIVSILEEGINSGEFSKNVEAQKTAEIIICLVEGGYAMAKVTGEYGYIDSALEHTEGIIASL